MKKLSLIGGMCLVLLSSAQLLFAQQNNSPVVSIIPEPVSLVQQSGSFTITPSTTIYLAGKDLERSSTYFNEYLQKYYGFHLKVKKVKDANEIRRGNAIVLDYKHIGYPIEGAYTFESNKNGVKINGDNGVGVFYGIQTLIQLLPTTPSQSLEIACVNITDHPRFKYRGMMLDCGRHFFDTAFVKKFINFIAMHKMNRFHWHLTEDQGWRIQIKKYPKLTSIGAWRDSTLIGHYGSGKYDHVRYGGFYTQDEIKAIVKYAQERYVTIIPEIEMPGHSTAAISAYPELSCGSPKVPVGSTWGVYDTILCPSPSTFHFYENVLNEVMKLFPSHYIHI
ncbi:MAG: beta-N-acetylhexosaminidase, partial [Chitinophagaceae bacterium]